MAVTDNVSIQYAGTAADTKPAAPPDGATFIETDTGKFYAWNGSAWFLVSSRSFTGGPGAFITNTFGTRYIHPFYVSANATEAVVAWTAPAACTGQNLYVNCSSNTLNGTMVCTVRVAGSDTGVTVTVTAASTATFSDTSNTAAIAAGDILTLKVVENATTGSANLLWSMELA